MPEKYQTQSKEELLKKQDELRSNQATLRINKVTSQGGAQSQSQIRVVRKNIARILTAIRSNALKDLREKYKGKKHVPKILRKRSTRAQRTSISEADKKRTTVRYRKRVAKYPRDILFALQN